MYKPNIICIVVEYISIQVLTYFEPAAQYSLAQHHYSICSPTFGNVLGDQFFAGHKQSSAQEVQFACLQWMSCVFRFRHTVLSYMTELNGTQGGKPPYLRTGDSNFPPINSSSVGPAYQAVASILKTVHQGEEVNSDQWKEAEKYGVKQKLLNDALGCTGLQWAATDGLEKGNPNRANNFKKLGRWFYLATQTPRTLEQEGWDNKYLDYWPTYRLLSTITQLRNLDDKKTVMWPLWFNFVKPSRKADDDDDMKHTISGFPQAEERFLREKEANHLLESVYRLMMKKPLFSMDVEGDDGEPVQVLKESGKEVMNLLHKVGVA